MSSEQTRRVEAVRSGDWWVITLPAIGGFFAQANVLTKSSPGNARRSQ